MPASICGCLSGLLILFLVNSARSDDRTADTSHPVQDSQIDWNNENLIQVENALLKTIESTKLSAEVTGRIASLPVTEGELVKQNQVIGKIEDRASRLQLNRSKLATEIALHKSASQIDLMLAEKRSAVAKNELERAEIANTKIANTYAQKEIDRLRLVYDTTILEIERAQQEQRLLDLEASLMENDQKIAEELVLRHQVISPVAGMVVAVNKHRGEWVEPGMELLQIVNLDRLKIEGFISAIHAGGSSLVQQPARVSLQVGQEQLTLPGKVAFVYPEINPVSNQMRVHLEVENSDGLLSPGMRVQAVILPVTP